MLLRVDFLSNKVSDFRHSPQTIPSLFRTKHVIGSCDNYHIGEQHDELLKCCKVCSVGKHTHHDQHYTVASCYLLYDFDLIESEFT
jgi:hypothetical protein